MKKLRLSSPSLHAPLVRGALLTSVCALAISGARSEDIDIFSANPTNRPQPNVLLVLDNSSNWSATLGPNSCNTGNMADNTKFAAEMCALRTVISGLNQDVRMGLMFFAEAGGEAGAYVRYGIRDMTPTNRTAFVNMLAATEASGSNSDNSSSRQPYGKTMFEAFKYFGGHTRPALADSPEPNGSLPLSKTAFGPLTYAGGGDSSGAKRLDAPDNNNAQNRAAKQYGVVDQFPYDSRTSVEYKSPLKYQVNGECAKNFVIFISNGNPSPLGGDATGLAKAEELLANVYGGQANVPPAITSGGAEVHASKMDEFARFLKDTDVSDLPGRQKVITYTVAVYQRQNNGEISNTDQEMIKLMRSAAAAGGGKYFAAENANDLVQAIRDILNEVQAVNSVFVSASLPVSVNTQGTYLNQVYMGMFRPDAQGSPRWLGNLKQYKIVEDATGALFLGDMDNKQATNPATGFVSPNAKSFWTSPSSFWVNNPTGTPLSGNDSPDGEVVEKGGAAEQLRLAYATAQTTRNVFTCPAVGCSPGPLNSTAFNTTTIAGAAYQALFSPPPAAPLTAAELASMVQWIRGEDNVNGTPCDPVNTAGCTWTSVERGPGWNTTVRPSVHGDVLHSRPVVLNYESIGPFIFYGANDGTLRGTKGGRLATDGNESWAFVAPEFFAKFKRLRTETPGVKFPGSPAGTTPKDYFFDGPIGSYQDATRAWIFVTARRGGDVIYAFDVTNPASPQFMWKKSSADLGFSDLGQTWSEPKAFKVRASNTALLNNGDPIVIFGAGYDPGEDGGGTAFTNKGHGIFVLNARTGNLIKFFQSSVNGGAITASIPSDVAVIDHDFDTFGDRAYVGDMAGNVWRMDLNELDPANWKLFKFASLGPRKFFFRPDVVITRDYDLVLVGSGNREDPLNTSSTDRFYGLKDFKTGFDATGMVPVQQTDLVTGGSNLDTAKGWYVDLRPGEKVVNAPLSLGGITYFSTNMPVPPTSACGTNLGEARSYSVNFLQGVGADRNGDGNADDLSVVLTGGGLPPSPVGGVVQLDDGKLVDFIIGGGSSGSPIAPEKPIRNIPRVRQKLYWNTSIDK